ncbi:unnamed protein product [Lampetra fluviatilis]
MYSSIQQLRDRTTELQSQVILYESRRSDAASVTRYEQRLRELEDAQEQLMELTATRSGACRGAGANADLPTVRPRSPCSANWARNELEEVEEVEEVQRCHCPLVPGNLCRHVAGHRSLLTAGSAG